MTSGVRIVVTAVGIALGQLAVPVEAVAQAAPPASRSEYEACLAQEDEGLRAAVEKVTGAALADAVKGLDYKPIVAEEWRKGSIDDVLARRVDLALGEIRQETSWSELLTSLASRETQERLAKAAAERVYGARDVSAALERLADGVGREVGNRLERATGEAAEQASRCLRTYLRHRYGTTVAEAVTREAKAKAQIDATRGAASVSGGKVLLESGEGIAGLVAIIMRRQLGNIAGRVGQRLVGAVLSRVVSTVAGGIGLALIAKDIWELRNGVLPIIASEMKSPATREKVQDQLASAIASEIAASISEIGRRTSEGIVETLAEHRRVHALVLDLAERKPEFKRFLESIDPGQLGRLTEIAGLQLATRGEGALLARAADGSLAEAVDKWPSAALEIARDRRSLDAGFRWRALAGDAALPRVVELELHRRADPEALTRAGLARILEIDDRLAIGRLAGLGARTVEPLLELPAPDLKRLARALDETQLGSLSGYMTQLDKAAARRLLTTVAETPQLMQAVAPAWVRDAVLASRDQAAALTILLRREELLDVALLLQDIETVRSGVVSPRVLLARYPGATAIAGGLVVLLLLVLARMLFGRRPRSARQGANDATN